MHFTNLIVFVTAASALQTQVSYHSRDDQSTGNADIYNWIKRDGESADKRSGTYGEHIGEAPYLSQHQPLK